VNAYDENNDE
jgi:hypothetical protein